MRAGWTGLGASFATLTIKGLLQLLRLGGTGTPPGDDDDS